MGRAYAAGAAIISGTSFCGAASGLLVTFVSLRLIAAGFEASVVGMVGSAFFAGMLSGCFFVGRVVRHVGHIRAFAIFAALAAVSTLALDAYLDPIVWAALRFPAGASVTGLYVICESWLNAATPSMRRGRVLAVYFVAVALAYGLGQLLLTVIEIESTAPILVGGSLFALALVPVCLTRQPEPAIPERVSVDLPRVWRLSHIAVIGSVACGLLSSTMQTVGPIYGTMVGYSAATIAVLMAATQIGNLALQWPLGWLSDRVDRRWVLAGVAIAITVLSLAAPPVGALGLVFLIVLFTAWGGSVESLGAIAGAQANDWAEPTDYVTVAGTLLVAWGAGSVAGPWIGTAAIDAFGPDALFYCFALGAALLAGFTLWRLARRAQPASEQQEAFSVQPANPAGHSEYDASLWRHEDSA